MVTCYICFYGDVKLCCKRYPWCEVIFSIVYQSIKPHSHSYSHTVLEIYTLIYDPNGRITLLVTHKSWCDFAFICLYCNSRGIWGLLTYCYGWIPSNDVVYPMLITVHFLLQSAILKYTFLYVLIAHNNSASIWLWFIEIAKMMSAEALR